MQLIVLDKILELEPGLRARAVRNVPNTLSILESHFPRRPVLPGVLILGSMAQLAARLVEEQTRHTWRLAAAEQIRFRSFVRPGDQLELTVELKKLTPDSATLSGSASVDGKVVTTARVLRLAPDDRPAEP